MTAGFFISVISILDGKEYKLGDLPGWVTTEGFDIEGNSEKPVTQEELGMMLKAVLIDRFKCTFHRDMKEVSGFTLVVAPRGSKLQKASDQTAQSTRERNVAFTLIDERTQRQTGPAALSPRMNALLTSQKASLSTFAEYVSRFWTGPVVDRTGLEGFYSFSLKWQPDAKLGSEEIPRTGPSLTTAIEEQLGLKLVAGKVPVEYLVIDHIERPAVD